MEKGGLNDQFRERIYGGDELDTISLFSLPQRLILCQKQFARFKSSRALVSVVSVFAVEFAMILKR